jgi:hypothetical protein
VAILEISLVGRVREPLPMAIIADRTIAQDNTM